MTTSWMQPRKSGQAIETTRRPERNLAAKARKLLPRLMTSAAMIGLIAVANAASNFILTPSAFAKSPAAQGNQGNGNRGLGQGNRDLPAAAASPDDDQAESSSRAGRDRDDAINKRGAGTKVDFDLPVSEQLELGNDGDSFAEYLGKIDYPGKIADKALPAAAKGAEAKGKAVGLRRKENLDASSTGENRQASDRFAIDPRFYSQREVLAINLSSAAIAHLHRLGFARGTSTWTGGDTVTVLTVPTSMDALNAVDLLEAELPGEHFQLDHLYRLYQPAMKDDADKDQRTKPASVNGVTKCLDDRCYARTLIQWNDRFAACASEARIGVIDTDVDFRHPTFDGQKITHKSFLPAGRTPSRNWHGTGVLALLAGRPDSGTPGLVNQAGFFVANIFFAGDDGQPVTDTMSLLQALDWMKTSGVTLVNMSLAGMDDELIRRRIVSLSSQGLVFTAAAGNAGPAAEPSYPAAYPQVIAVTAISKQLRIFPFANRGSYIDLAAPGVDIWTAVPGSREGYHSGTSFAVPFVTALLAIQQQSALRLPKEKLLDYVKTVALDAPGNNQTYGRGLLQAPAECPASVATAAERVPVWDLATR